MEITTYTSYERAITHKIVPYFEPLHYTLQDMEQHPKYIQDFYQHELDRGLTANTIIHYHANIRKCLQYAFQIGMIRSNPADRVERPRKEKFKPEIDILKSIPQGGVACIGKCRFKGFGALPQQAFCNAKVAVVYTTALLA